MTKNKVDKHVENNMLDDLLDDQDKPKAPVTTAPYNYNHVYRQTDMGWDRADSYSNGRSSTRYYGDDDDYSDIPAHLRNPSPRKNNSVFNRTTTTTKSPRTWGSEAVALKAIDALIMGVNSGQKHYFIPAADAAALINATTQALGEFFDQIGLCWGVGGSKNAKMLVADILANNVFYDTASGYKELDFDGNYSARDGVDRRYDPTTGELLEDDDGNDEERKAIMEVDGGAVLEEDGDNAGEV